VTCIFERSDADVRKLEAGAQVGVLRGDLPAPVVFVRMISFITPMSSRAEDRVLSRPARQPARGPRARGGPGDAQRVLLHGGFTLAALAGGAARVTSLDSSGRRSPGARELAANPALDGERAEWLEADAFATLRKFRDAARSFD